MVVIVMVPAIGAFHYGWGMIQDNPVFVKEHERKRHPFFIYYEAYQQKIKDKLFKSSEPEQK